MNKKFRAIAFAAAVLPAFLASVANAALVPMSGTLHAQVEYPQGSGWQSPPDVILGTSYGSFQTSTAKSPPPGSPPGGGADARISVRTATDKVEMQGYVLAPGGSALSSAVVNFTTTQSALWNLLFLAYSPSPGSSFALKDAGGNTVFTSNCFQTGICANGSSPNSNNYADIYLAAGSYSLSLTTVADPRGNTTYMLLTTPIPAALPLFGSALAGLVVIRRGKFLK